MDMLEGTARKGNGDASEEIDPGYLNEANVRNEKKPRKTLSEETHSILDLTAVAARLSSLPLYRLPICGAERRG